MENNKLNPWETLDLSSLESTLTNTKDLLGMLKHSENLNRIERNYVCEMYSGLRDILFDLSHCKNSVKQLIDDLLERAEIKDDSL